MPRVGKREFDYSEEGRAAARRYARATGKGVTVSKKKHKGRKIKVKVQKKKLKDDPNLNPDLPRWQKKLPRPMPRLIKERPKPRELQQPIPKPRERIQGDEWAKKPRERIQGDEWADQSPIRKVKPKRVKPKPRPGPYGKPAPRPRPAPMPYKRRTPIRPWEQFRKPIKEKKPRPSVDVPERRKPKRTKPFIEWFERQGKPAKTREELELEFKKRLKRQQLRGR